MGNEEKYQVKTITDPKTGNRVCYYKYSNNTFEVEVCKEDPNNPAQFNRIQMYQISEETYRSIDSQADWGTKYLG